MMKKRVVSRFLAAAASAVMVVSAVPGCGTFAVAASDEDNTITISVQNTAGVQEGWEAVAAAYQELHPEINIVIDLKATDGYDQWVQTMFTTEDPTADIVNINLAGDVKTGKSINYSDYLDNDSPYSDGTWREQFDVSRQKIDASTGIMDALSLETVEVFWLYNQDIFDEVGVEAPTTWDEFVEVCEKIYEAGYQPIAIAGDYDSFYSGAMGWLAQIYADQVSRDIVNIDRAQEGDYCYDPDIDGTWEYDLTDPLNDDADKVTQNPVRAFAAIASGEFRGDTEGMKTVWTNMAKMFPKYAGEDAFFGTDSDGAKTLFYQGKAAIMVDGGWALIEYMNNMADIAAGGEIEDSDGNVIENPQEFELGTFNMPSMEGEGILAEARTIEVANGFIGCVSKNTEHDDKVIDLLMYYSSTEGMSIYMNALLEAGGSANGPSLVYGVEYPEEINEAFASLTAIGNAQKDFNNVLARGIGESAETFREFYEYCYDYLTGEIDVDTWAERHQANIEEHVMDAAAEKGIGESDLANPQNEPTGN